MDGHEELNGGKRLMSRGKWNRLTFSVCPSWRGSFSST